ncbi:aminomethyltransferase family protein [soil metagenome]
MDERALLALRTGVTMTRSDHFRAFRFSGGEAAWETVNALCSGDLFLRDGQVAHTLWLDERAHPLADVYVARDDDTFVILAESRGEDLFTHARSQLRDGAVLDDLTPTHRILSLNGPFAWELLGRIVGAEVIGLPYLNLFHLAGGWAFRAGKTGEFGYDLLVANDAAAKLETRLLTDGERFDLVTAELDVLDQCALENWFFNVRKEGRLDVTPFELQLQWRTTTKRAFIGSAALEAHRIAGIRRRLVMMTAADTGVIAQGNAVHLFGENVGVVANAGYSPLRRQWVALALVDVGWAHPGIDAFEVMTPNGRVAARTVTPPLPNNLSLHVNLQRHAYATRDEIVLPPESAR